MYLKHSWFPVLIDKNVFNILDKADQTSTELGALQSGGHSMGSIGSVSAGFEKWFVKKISSPVTTECMPNLINNGLLIFLTYNKSALWALVSWFIFLGERSYLCYFSAVFKISDHKETWIIMKI